MSAPTRSPLNTTGWFGHLTRENYQEVAARMRLMLDGKRYTFVSVHDGHPGLTQVRTGQTLADPLRAWESGDLVGISCHDRQYVWGISTSAATQQEAHDSRTAAKHNFVALSFRDDYRGEQLTIEQFNGYGELLQWIVAIEATR